MASTNTNSGLLLLQSANDSRFQDRCYFRFLNAAISVSTEDPVAPSHAQRLAFAAALFNNAVNRQMLAMLVLTNAKIQVDCLADPTTPGGNALDSDIDFEIASIFTGVAISRGW